jgi:hypothetical protein
VVSLSIVGTILPTYSVAILLASVFGAVWSAVADSGNTAKLRGTVFQGFVLATDSCQLAPADWSGVCSSSVVPIEGELRFRRRGTVQRTTVELDSAGVFTRQLEPGTYRVRLIEPRVAERSLKRSAYRIYPRQVRIQGVARGPARAASQANIFLVAHKSRGTPPGVEVSDGFRKG